MVIFYYIRLVHSDCALSGDVPQDKCICLLCKEEPPVTQPYTEIQTREASKDSEGQGGLIEATVQKDADMVTEKHTDLSEVTSGHIDSAENTQAEAVINKEIPMVLGKSTYTKCFKILYNSNEFCLGTKRMHLV